MKGKLEVKLERIRKVMEAKKVLVLLGVESKGITIFYVQDPKYSLEEDDDDEGLVKFKPVKTKFKHNQNYFG